MTRVRMQTTARAAVTVATLLAAGRLRAGDPPVSRRIVVDIPDCRIAVMENGRVTRVYPIAVGAAATPSPSGEFVVITRIPNPTWYAPHKVVPPGKANPLGTRWIGLSLPGYGIHGTNQPQSIGHRASHGCIRMRNRDVEELFRMVRVGDPVKFHSEAQRVRRAPTYQSRNTSRRTPFCASSLKENEKSALLFAQYEETGADGGQ